MNPGKIYKAIKEIEKDYFPQPLDISSYDQTYLDQLAENEYSLKIVFDRVNFRILNISSNLEALSGYSYEDWTKNDMFLAFSMFMSGDNNFIFTWVKSANHIFETTGSILNYKSAFCGVKFTHRLGHTLRTLWRYLPIEVSENTLVKTAIISVDDVSHLVKGDAYWGRTTFGDHDNPQYHHIHSIDNIDIFQDIISVREKDVLRLSLQGKESKEIAKELFISPNTVDNHRRNMIKRTGARDTTSLIQICRMCGII